jgi:uncharacterized protein YhfF
MKDAGVTMEESKLSYPGAVTYRFGDSAALCEELLALVRSGRKRATCTALAEIAEDETAPYLGRCDIAVDFDGRPQLVTRTVDLRRVRFRDMTEEMALMEDEDLARWRDGHERYYRRAGIFAPGMELIRERFEVVGDLAFGEGPCA